MTTFSVERVISGSGYKFDKETTLSKGTIDEAILAYLKAFHTAHPCWIISDTTGNKLTHQQIEDATEQLLSTIMV